MPSKDRYKRNSLVSLLMLFLAVGVPMQSPALQHMLKRSSNPGLWCSLLIPFSLLTNFLVGQGTRIYTELCVVSFGLLITALFWKGENPHRCIIFNIFCLVMSFVLASILVGLTSRGILLCFFISYSSIWFSCWFCSSFLVIWPVSFSPGEAIIVVQGIILFTLSCFLCAIDKFSNPRHLMVEPILDSTKFTQVLLFGCLLLLFTLAMLRRLNSIRAIYSISICVGVFTYALWNVYLGKEPVLWLLSFSFDSSKRVVLILFWFGLVCWSILFVIWKNDNKMIKASTSMRKVFHIAVTLVYVPGVLMDPELLSLASALALAVFYLLELIRLFRLPPLGTILDNSFRVFLDEKDSGGLILTPIYLLVGCSCPLWLYSQQFSDKGYHICLLSGIISVGLGDTAASVGGSILGKHRWPGSEKTIEGTACAIVAQLMCGIPLLSIGHALSVANLMIAALGIVLTSLLEANTVQVDNLVLPLFLFPILRLIK